jgi:hypothetical protein
MRALMARRLSRAGVAGGVGALVFAALVSVGAAVSPSGTPAVTAQYPKKVTICHKTGSKKNPFRTIRVSRNAVKAHLRHGDSIGPCSTATFTVCHTAKNSAKKTLKVKSAKKTLKVKGAKKTAKHLRHGDRLGKCKKPKKGKNSAAKGKAGKSGEKGKKRK